MAHRKNVCLAFFFSFFLTRRVTLDHANAKIMYKNVRFQLQFLWSAFLKRQAITSAFRSSQVNRHNQELKGCVLFFSLTMCCRQLSTIIFKLRLGDAVWTHCFFFTRWCIFLVDKVFFFFLTVQVIDLERGRIYVSTGRTEAGWRLPALFKATLHKLSRLVLYHLCIVMVKAATYIAECCDLASVCLLFTWYTSFPYSCYVLSALFTRGRCAGWCL